jgi:membrane-associated phospholipid phosphatase
MLEAAAFSAVTSEAVKLAAGRLRPFETSSPDQWRAGGSSFPSSHASVTFAIGTVLAESGNDQYRWVRRTIGYGAASAVAYARVHDGAHWLSDTVAGAALGIATARFAMRPRDATGSNATLSFTPLPEGAGLNYTVRFK